MSDLVFATKPDSHSLARELQNEPNLFAMVLDIGQHLGELIDENGGGPGVRLRKRRQKKGWASEGKNSTLHTYRPSRYIACSDNPDMTILT
jgi:hypothetical protein